MSAATFEMLFYSTELAGVKIITGAVGSAAQLRGTPRPTHPAVNLSRAYLSQDSEPHWLAHYPV